MSHRLAGGCLAGLAMVAGALVPTTVVAAPALPASAAAGVCVTGVTGAPVGARSREGDPAALSAAQVQRFEARTRRLVGPDPSIAARVGGDAGTRVVDVAVHVVAPRAGVVEVDRARARRAVTLLSRAFAGRQSVASVDSAFRFRMTGYDRTVNRDWYTADVITRSGRLASREMKRALHVGGPETLNLYLTRPVELLGWASFPQQVHRQPRLDGVVVNIGALLGGRIAGYDRGDTVTHEVGHWMGLFHTFQGGCSRLNDRVADTAPAALPNYDCPEGLDTCRSDELLDPIHNFMDYSLDRCMDSFTAGQDERMLQHWVAYRQP